MELKLLKEKCAAIKEKIDIEMRSGSLNADFIEPLEKEYEEIKNRIEEIRTQNTMEKEVKHMSNPIEVRSLLAESNPSIMKEEVFGALIEKFDADADVLALAETITNNGETLNFIVEDSTAMESKAVAEGVAVSEVEPILKTIVAKPQRKGAYLEVSKEFLAGMGNASYEAHLQDLLFGSVARKLRNDMVKVIREHEGVEKIETTVENALSIDDIAELILSAPTGQYTLVGAPKTVRTIKKMKDANGNFIVQNGVVNGALQSSIMGVKLAEHAGMQEVATGNVALALVGQGAVKQVISDEVEVLPVYGENVKAGKRVYNIDIMHDVVVAEEDKVKLLAIK